MSCKTENEEINTPDYIKTGDEIELTENSVIETKLKTEEIKQQYIQTELNVNGTVKVISDHLAQVASPFPGRVVKSFVKLGQYVKKGSPIFELQSSDFFSIQQDFFSVQQELKQAELNVKRQRDLYNHAVGIKRELEEAETDYKLKKIAFDQIQSAMKMYNGASQQKMGQSLIVRSPISGQVINNDLIVGQYLKEDHEALVTIADLSKVWISAQVKENDLGFLSELQSVNFSIDAFPSKRFSGKIINIGQILNEETRTLDVLIKIDNVERLLKPGVYVNVTFNGIEKKELVLPKTSVFQENDNTYVFIKTAPKKYNKYKIKGSSDSNNSENFRVSEGLTEGSNVVVAGGIYLMSAK